MFDNAVYIRTLAGNLRFIACAKPLLFYDFEKRFKTCENEVGAKMVSEFIRGRCAAVATSVGGFLVVVGLFVLYIRCSGMASGAIKLEPRVGGFFGASIIGHRILVVEHPLVYVEFAQVDIGQDAAIFFCLCVF